MNESLKQTAMLGTSRKVLQESDFPIPLQAYCNIITKKSIEPEDAFLQILAANLGSGKKAGE